MDWGIWTAKNYRPKKSTQNEPKPSRKSNFVHSEDLNQAKKMTKLIWGGRMVIMMAQTLPIFL